MLGQQGIDLVFLRSMTGNIARSRNGCMEMIRQNESPKIFMIWFDSDILIFPEQSTFDALSQMLQKALMERDAIVCCDYKTADNQYQMREWRTLGRENKPAYRKDTRKRFTDTFTDFKTGGASGLGLSMGYFPKDYIFHSDWLGEDIYFWNDNKDIRLIRYNHFVPKHVKELEV